MTRSLHHMNPSVFKYQQAIIATFYMLLHVSFTLPSCLLFKCPMWLRPFSLLSFFIVNCFSLCIISAFNCLRHLHCKIMLHQLLVEFFCCFKPLLLDSILQTLFYFILKMIYYIKSSNSNYKKTVMSHWTEL